MEGSDIATLWSELSAHPIAIEAHLIKETDAEDTADTTTVERKPSTDTGTGHSLDRYTLTTTWKQPNLTTGETSIFLRQHFLSGDRDFISTAAVAIDRQWCVYNKNGDKHIIIRLDKSGTKAKQYIEIWSNSFLMRSIDVANIEGHGMIIDNDGVFGSVRWSADEETLLYVAESKDNMSKSYFDTSADKDSSPDKSAELKSDEKFAPYGDKFVYKDSWGEQMTNKTRTVTCLMNLTTSKTKVLDSFSFSAGQSMFCDDDKSIICVGYEDAPFKLGRIYCTNRESAIYHINIKTSNYAILSSLEKAIRSPVFNREGSQLVWLENAVFGAHQQCSKLMICDWKTKVVTTCVDIVKISKDISRFPGIYTQNLQLRCWSNDSKYIIMETAWYSCMTLISINIKNGKIVRLTPDTEKYASYSLKHLDVCDDKIIATRSAPNQPACLVIADIYSGAGALDWKEIDVPYKYTDVKWRVSSIKSPDQSNPYEYIVIEPKRSSSPLPLALWSHGGPHAITPTDYIPYIVGIVKAGFAVVAVNYRGSIGFGQVPLKSLCGNIGHQDVMDVHSVVQKLVNTGNYDKEKVVCIGGSHGGFLSIHLIGQYPSYYKAACVRNPVIDLCSMFGTSDIPDWVLSEAGIDYEYTSILSSDDLKKLYKMSPIRYAKNIRTPVLLMLGREDIRVPIQQGLLLRKVLMSKEIVCRTLLFDNNSHPINKVEADADCFINLVNFILKYTSPASDSANNSELEEQSETN